MLILIGFASYFYTVLPHHSTNAYGHRESLRDVRMSDNFMVYVILNVMSVLFAYTFALYDKIHIFLIALQSYVYYFPFAIPKKGYFIH